MNELALIQEQLAAMRGQEEALTRQVDAILEQLTMTKGAVQILEKLINDIQSKSPDSESEE